MSSGTTFGDPYPGRAPTLACPFAAGRGQAIVGGNLAPKAERRDPIAVAQHHQLFAGVLLVVIQQNLVATANAAMPPNVPCVSDVEDRPTGHRKLERENSLPPHGDRLSDRAGAPPGAPPALHPLVKPSACRRSLYPCAWDLYGVMVSSSLGDASPRARSQRKTRVQDQGSDRWWRGFSPCTELRPL
jgi:hypothetical protein